MLFKSIFALIEISKVDEPSLHGLKLTLQIFDYCTLTIFVLEIILKWIDGFWTFWNNGWNIFDFVVTAMVCTNKKYNFTEEIQFHSNEHMHKHLKLTRQSQETSIQNNDVA